MALQLRNSTWLHGTFRIRPYLEHLSVTIIEMDCLCRCVSTRSRKIGLGLPPDPATLLRGLSGEASILCDPGTQKPGMFGGFPGQRRGCSGNTYLYKMLLVGIVLQASYRHGQAFVGRLNSLRRMANVRANPRAAITCSTALASRSSTESAGPPVPQTQQQRPPPKQWILVSHLL